MKEESVGFGVSNEFLAHLADLARDERDETGAWWRDVLSRNDLFLAVRHKSLNVYCQGASLFRVDEDETEGHRARPWTHVKYLVRQQQALVELRNGKFNFERRDKTGKPKLLEIGWTHYASKDTLPDMVHAASDLAGVEKAGLHHLIIRSPHVIDVEVSLERLDEAARDDESKSGRKFDRLDVVTLEQQDDGIAVVFHEAKHFTNPELREKEKGKLKVVNQLERYQRALTHYDPELQKRYKATCQALVALDGMRRRVLANLGQPDKRAERDQLIWDVAKGRELKIDHVPRLIIFGYDGDKKREHGPLEEALKELRNDNSELEIYYVGNPKAAKGRIPSSKRGNSVT